MTGSMDSPIPLDRRTGFWAQKVLSATAAMMKAYGEARAIGITQNVIAARLERNKSQVSNWLRGQRNLTVRTLAEMALAMDCDLRIQFVPFNRIPRVNYEWSPAEAETDGASSQAMVFQVPTTFNGTSTPRPATRIDARVTA